MEKVAVKVRIDEALSFNLDIPLEMDVIEFSAIIERAKTISRASGATMVTGLRRGPAPVEVGATQEDSTRTRKYRVWDKEKEMEFYNDYKNTSRKDRVPILGEKYGLSTEGSISQTFYKTKKKYGLTGLGQGARTDKRHNIFDQEIKNRIASQYEDGGTAKVIANALNLDRNQVTSQIRYMKKVGIIKRTKGYERGRVLAPSSVQKKTNGANVDRILENIFSGKKKIFGGKGTGHTTTDKERKAIMKRWDRYNTIAAHDVLAKELDTTRNNLSKTVSNWRTKRGL